MKGGAEDIVWWIVQKQKARVEDMIAEEGTIDGLEHIECKIFK